MQVNSGDNDYSDLVNPRGIRHTVRRLFTGSIAEILGELLQNSQRAAATSVSIEAGGDGFAFEDDGHGLAGLGGFYKLLRLAESGYENPSVAEQDPMGVGINALLASDQVSRVTIASGGIEVDLDTARWWTEPEYYETWADRVSLSDFDARGLRIKAISTEGFIKAVVGALTYSNPHSRMSDPPCPARGYQGILDVKLNGESVDTSLPARFEHGRTDVTAEYEGCPVSICAGQTASAINWYGQVIDLRRTGLFAGFSVVMQVRAGRPVNPMSPSRLGIIADERLSTFVAWVRDRIFERLCDPSMRAALTPEFVKACHALDVDRARRVSPVFVAARYLASPDRYDSFDDVTMTEKEEVAEYGDSRLMLEPEIEVRLGPVILEAHGLDSFVDMLDRPASQLVAGCPERANVQTLVWKPGAMLENVAHTEMFHEPGEWAVSGGGEITGDFRPVTAACVWAFTEPGSWDVHDSSWTVAASDRVSFYQNISWAAFEPGDDSLNEQTESYGNSIDAAVRRELGRCVPQCFSFSDLAHVVPGEISTLAFIREPGRNPTALAVTMADGTTEIVSIYG